MHSSEKINQVVSVGERKFHYVDTWYEDHSTHRSHNYGEVVLTEVDDNGKENGLYMENRYLWNGIPYDEEAGTVIGIKEDGKFVGPVYAFYKGKLDEVRLGDDKVITSEDRSFASYRTMAPNFKETFKMLKKTRSAIDGKNIDGSLLRRLIGNKRKR